MDVGNRKSVGHESSKKQVDIVTMQIKLELNVKRTRLFDLLYN